MLKIYIENTFNPDFTKRCLCNYLSKLFNDEITDEIYKQHLNYLDKTYSIKLEDLQKAFKKAIHCVKTVDNFIIFCDTATLVKNQNLNTLLDFINYGNLSYRGTNILSKLERAIKNNLITLYRYYLHWNGSKLWD